MKKLLLKTLNLENFEPYGTFAGMLNPKSPKIGEEPIEFYRDKLRLDLGDSHTASFSICRVVKRNPVINVIEYHNSCGEGILPLDGDVILQVAPATPEGRIPFSDIEAFHVPMGTMVTIFPGVWHHAPFAYKKNVVNVLIVLPERTYANDCHAHAVPKARQMAIQDNGSHL
jgi:ureidoglycolate lyase